ncbi:hypothetical protein [Tersicoccus phoenicis]|nr:hypothetical protein [Tersicoccus phoenicis]
MTDPDPRVVNATVARSTAQTLGLDGEEIGSEINTRGDHAPFD